MKLTRGQKTVRNFLLCVLLWMAACAVLGFPPYTVRGMLDQVERQYLLSDLEPVLVERDSRSYASQLSWWHDTYLLAQTGDTYIYTTFSRHLWEVRPEHRRNLKMSQGSICAARDGTLYVAGNFADAASASVEVTAEKITQFYDPDTDECRTIFGEQRTFTYQGEKVSESLFSFRYRKEDEDGWYYNTPESEYNLEAAAQNWYRFYHKEDLDGFSWIHADLPVKVTLYGQDGGILDVLELSVDTYEFSRW